MKLWKLLTTLAATAVVSAFVLTSAQGAVKDTKHNMNNVFGTGTIQDNQVCLPCHAPHNQPDRTLGALWNHVMPTDGYTLWDGAEGLDETSKKCLSCHDGTVAVDSYGGYSFGNGDLTKGALTKSTFGPTTGTHTLGASQGDALGNTSTAAFVIGNNQDLTHDHPVGVIYPASLDAVTGAIVVDASGVNAGNNKPGSGFTSPSLWTRTGYTNSSGVVVPYVKPDGSAGGTVAGGGFHLEGGNVAGVGVVGCGSCHTPHSATYNFLTVSNYGSQLCMTCHTR